MMMVHALMCHIKHSQVLTLNLYKLQDDGVLMLTMEWDGQ